MLPSLHVRPMVPRNDTWDGTGYQRGLAQRLPRDSSIFFEGDFGDTTHKLRPPKRSWSGKSFNFDETIWKLYGGIRAVNEYLRPFQSQFEKEIEHIKIYATPSMIDSLWEMRLEMKPKPVRRNSERGEYGGNGGKIGEMIRMSRKAKQAWIRAEKAMQVAANCTKTTVSAASRKLRISEDREAIERTVPKLQTLGSQCLALLIKARKKYSQMEALIKELEFLTQVIDEWKEFADGRTDNEDYDGGEYSKY